eukprot:325667-Prymnesium_polylepis.1
MLATAVRGESWRVRIMPGSSRIWDTLQKCVGQAALQLWSKPPRFFYQHGKRSPRPPHPPPGGRS